MCHSRLPQSIFDARKKESKFKETMYYLMQQHKANTCRLELAGCTLLIWKTRQLKPMSLITIFPLNIFPILLHFYESAVWDGPFQPTSYIELSCSSAEAVFEWAIGLSSAQSCVHILKNFQFSQTCSKPKMKLYCKDTKLPAK